MYLNENQSFEEMFDSYIMNVAVRNGLFSDEDEYLCDEDYKILFKSLVKKTQVYRNYEELRNNNQSSKFLCYFHRCFGIYLREAVLRYATSFSEDGLWAPLHEGVAKDFYSIGFTNEAYHGFWSNSRRNLRSVLTGSADKVSNRNFFWHIFQAFRSPDVKYTHQEGNNEYARHLLKLAILPKKYNPITDFGATYEAYRTNSIARYLRECDLQGLMIHSDTESHLAIRIRNFFIYVDGARRDGMTIDEARRSRYNYFDYWMEQAYGIPLPSESDGRGEELVKSESQVVYRIIAGSENVFLYRIPDILSLKLLFPDISGLKNTSSIVLLDEDEDGELYFEINDGKIDFDGATIIERNERIEKLLISEYVRVIFEGSDPQSVPNPWFTNERWHLLNEDGKKTDSWEPSKNGYVVLPTSWGNVTQCVIKACGDESDGMQFVSKHNLYSENSGKNVYELKTVLQNFEYCDEIELRTANGQVVSVEIQYPSHVHLCSDFDGKPRFIAQKSNQKIAIGSIEFDHIGEISQDQVENAFGEGIKASVCSNRVLISNTTSHVVAVKSKQVGDKIFPYFTILPENADVWVAKQGENFAGYLCGVSEGLPSNWQNVPVSNMKMWNGRVNVKNLDSVCKVRFVNDGLEYDLISPYHKASCYLQLGESLESKNISRLNNPFGGVVPAGASYYFKWIENGVEFKVEIPLSMRISVNHCYNRLGINGACVEFGWTYQGTCFVDEFQQSQNYEGSSVQRSQEVFTETAEKREQYLLDLVCAGVASQKSSNPKSSNLGTSHISRKVPKVKMAPGVTEEETEVELNEYNRAPIEEVVDARGFNPYTVIYIGGNGMVSSENWLLHEVSYLRIIPEVSSKVVDAYKRGWIAGGGYSNKFVFHSLLNDPECGVNLAYALGETVAYWIFRFYSQLLYVVDELEDGEGLSSYLDKNLVFSLAGVDINELIEMKQQEKDNLIDEKISSAVGAFVPLLKEHLSL